jgi:UDP-2,4-diacetamido-2,4,6-trideoxy-beta-L-altropyranose hydrolase
MPSIRELPPLLVRADASEVTGMGHVMRCMALAQAWQDRGGPVTFLGAIPQSLGARIEVAGFDYRHISAPCPDPSDLHSILSLLDDVNKEIKRSPWVVLDGYHFDPTYHAMLRAAVAG